MLLSNRSIPPLIISSWIKLPWEQDKQRVEKYRVFFFFFKIPRQTCVGCQEEWWGVCVCVCLTVCLVHISAEQGRIEKHIWVGFWASDPAEIEGISCSVCRLHCQPFLPSLLSFTFVLDPQTIQILSHSSSHHSQSLSLPHHRYFLHPLLPLIIIRLSAFLTPQLSCCFSTLYSLDFTCLFLPSNHPSSSLLSFFFSFLRPSIHSPREKYGSDEHGEPGTNQSIDLSMYPSLCPSDRQQKTKCLLSETFPISFSLHPTSLCCTIPLTW